MLEVLREDGAPAMKVDGGKRGAPEKIANLFVGGTVFLRLSPKKGEGNLDDPYRITVAGRPIEAGAEREPNNTVATATVLSPAVLGSGLISPKGDIDFWTTAVSGPVNINIRSIPGVTLDVRVRGLGAGRELARFRVGSDGAAPTRVAPEAEGCCVIEIRDSASRAANPKDRYTLSVTP